MSEKDSVSIQDIPAVLRALGTLALAAVAAVAIKWFISRDKTENTDDNESKFQCNQDPIEDGQSPRDHPKVEEEIPEYTIKETQVSDEQGMTVLAFDCRSHGLLKSSLDTSCQNNVKEDGECLTDPKRLLGDLTTISCKLYNVAGPQTALHDSWGANVSISGLPTAIVDERTNYAHDQVFSSCLTQTWDKTSYERSQVQQPDTGTSNGECTYVMNLKYLGCKSQPMGDDNMVPGICLKHKTVNVGWDEDLFHLDTYENLNYDSEIDTPSKYSVENKNNMHDSISGKNLEINTKEYISERENAMNACAPGLPESHECVNTFISAYNPHSHELLTRSHNTKQLSIYTAFKMQDILQTVDVIQEVEQTTLTVSNGDTALTNALCKGSSQDETFNFKHSNHVTCTQQTSVEYKIYVPSEEILEEANENLKSSSTSFIPASAHIPEEHVAVEEENGKLFLSGNTLHNNHIGKHNKVLPSRDDPITGGSQNPIKRLYLPNSGAMDESKIKTTISHHTKHVLQWNTTSVYNSKDFIDLMYPMDCHAPKHSIIPLIEKDEGQAHLDDNVSLSTGKLMYVCKEKENNNSNADVESFFESSRAHNITNDKPVPCTMTSNFSRDPSTLPTLNSTLVTKTEFLSSIKSVNNEQDNKVIYNCHKHDANFHSMDNKEFCTEITNGYLSRCQKPVDMNGFVCSFDKNTPEEFYDKNQQSVICKPLSNSLPNPVTLAEEFSSRSPVSSNENHSASCVMMDISKSKLKFLQTMQVIKTDTNLSNEDFHVCTVEKTSGVPDSLYSPAENPIQRDSNSNDTCCEKDSVTSCTSSPAQNKEQEKILQHRDQERIDTVETDATFFSRDRIMSTIAETPELILPEYQSVFISERKMPLMTKSCDNIYSGPSFQGSALKNKAQSMLCLLTEYYTTKLHSLENGPLEEVARGCFIRIPKGFQNIGEGVRFQLTLGNCLELLRLARKNSVPELLKAVYTLISDNYLNVLKNSAIYGQLNCLEREKILHFRMRGKLSLCVIETQSIFGMNKNISGSEDMSQDQPKDQLYSLDMESNQWEKVTYIPEEACLKGCSICSMHNYLFIGGGIQKTKNGLSCSNKLFCYNPLTDIWTQLTPMNQARSQLKLVPLDGYLFAIGGECLHTMERYDPRSNKWTFVASLPKGSFAVAHEAAACGGEIYISGGHLFYRLLKYNPSRDQWEECPFNASKGRSCDMVAVGHILYRFDMHKDSTVHIFKYNTTAKVWSEYTTTFPNSKAPFRCAVLDGTIYCLNRETTVCFSVEEEKAIFESSVISKVPTKGVGYPCPVVLSLQGSLSQTSV